ncbi:MAG: hypothetical protein E7627_02035 [Ruminococcaceae bacterium]|nr:hypothetical protein [Oscillospiraceae bacterium]
MKSLLKSKMFLLVMCTMLCLIIGLLAVLAVVLRSKSLAERSAATTYRAEMETAAYSIIDDVNSGDYLKAYHHASTAADYALRAGERKLALQFHNVAERVTIGELNAEIANDVRQILNTPADDTGNSAEQARSLPTQMRKYQPSSVAVTKYKQAKNCANRVVGGSNIFARGTWCDGGRYLFTCDNAYVLVDEKTILPIEASISLPKGVYSFTPEECEEIAKEYLKILYPADSLAFESAKQIIEEETTGNLTILYVAGSKEISATVSPKSGKVVSFSRRQVSGIS